MPVLPIGFAKQSSFDPIRRNCSRASVIVASAQVDVGFLYILPRKSMVSADWNNKNKLQSTTWKSNLSWCNYCVAFND